MGDILLDLRANNFVAAEGVGGAVDDRQFDLKIERRLNELLMEHSQLALAARGEDDQQIVLALAR